MSQMRKNYDKRRIAGEITGLYGKPISIGWNSGTMERWNDGTIERWNDRTTERVNDRTTGRLNP